VDEDAARGAALLERSLVPAVGEWLEVPVPSIRAHEVAAVDL
jgi:hypothetical protein